MPASREGKHEREASRRFAPQPRSRRAQVVLQLEPLTENPPCVAYRRRGEHSLATSRETDEASDIGCKVFIELVDSTIGFEQQVQPVRFEASGRLASRLRRVPRRRGPGTMRARPGAWASTMREAISSQER